jgi:hypothetical protein
MDYRARFYSPYLNHFTQPDTIVPNPINPQLLNRYSYVGNRPLNFNDPSGHAPCGDGERINCDGNLNPLSLGGPQPRKREQKDERGSVNPPLIKEDEIVEKTIVIGTIAAQPTEDMHYTDDKVDQITDKGQWIAEFISLIVDFKDVFQPPTPAPRNVIISMSYEEYENGDLDNFKFFVDNKSGVNVYLATIKVTVNRPDFSPACDNCGNFVVASAFSDYLITAKPGEVKSATICSNCWGNPGIVGFLPVKNGNSIAVAPSIYTSYAHGFDGMVMDSIVIPPFR